MAGAGFENDLLYAINADLTGDSNPDVDNGLTIDNTIWLGRTSTIAGRSQIDVFIIDAGTGIDITRIESAGPGSPGILTFSNTGAMTDLHTARFIVSPGGTADGANYTTIASAYAAAVLAGAPQNVFVQPGASGLYIENLTLTAGINISAYPCDAQNASVTIVGKLSYSDTGRVALSGLELRTNADFALSVTGANNSDVLLIDCKLNGVNANAIEFTSSNASSEISLKSCTGDIASTRAYFTHSGAGKLIFSNSVMENNGASTTASTASGSGTVQILNSYFANAITTSSTAVLQINNTEQHGAIIVGGTGAGQGFSQSFLDGGTSSSVSIGTGVSIPINNCTIESTNGSAAITGAGTLRSAGLTFSNTATNINTTTQTVLVGSNDAIQVTAPGAYPYTVLKQDALVAVSTAAARTINLPSSPQTGEKHIIKDVTGSAASNNITVQGNGSNIDGASSATINVAYGSATFVYSGTIWLNI